MAFTLRQLYITLKKIERNTFRKSDIQNIHRKKKER